VHVERQGSERPDDRRLVVVAREVDQEAKQRVEGDVAPEEPSVEAALPVEREEKDEEAEARPGEIELGGVQVLPREPERRQVLRREANAQWKMRRKPVAAAVQEAADPPDRDPERHARRDGVAHAPYGELLGAHVKDPAADRRHVAAVEDEAALPEAK